MNIYPLFTAVFTSLEQSIFANYNIFIKDSNF